MLQRHRHPGSQGLLDLADDLETLANERNLRVMRWEFVKEDMLPAGSTPVAPLRAEDLEGVRLPVLLLSAEGRVPTTRYLFLTNMESLETAPREPAMESQKRPSPSADLSASGLAAVLAALLDVAASAQQNYSIDLLVLSGELGYRGWTGLTWNPLVDRLGGDFFSSYTLGITVQNVGACDLEIHPYGTATSRPSAMRLFAAIRNETEGFRIGMNESRLRPIGQTFGDFGVHLQPANSLPSFGTNAIALTGGWWAGRTQAGLLSDIPSNMCISQLEEISRFQRHLMGNMDSLPQDRVPDCERNLPPRCSDP